MFGVGDNQSTQDTPSLPFGPQIDTNPPAQPSAIGSGLTNPIIGQPPDTNGYTMPPAPPAQSATVTTGGDDLLNIKQHALQNLTPLVGQLDQQPEERFKTIMMLIQASDNPQLIKQAYEAAHQIPDQKARAQALIDVVNEINYFTQKKDNTTP